MSCYLDYNASAPLLDIAKDKLIDALNKVGNPSSIHTSGRAVRAIIEESRIIISELVNASPNNVIFTSGATEANRLALASADKIIASTIEHDSILQQPNVRLIPVSNDGTLDLSYLENFIKKNKNTVGKTVVSVMLANNETGIVQPVSEASNIAHLNGCYLHCDAVQACGRIKIDMEELGCDMVTLSSHKIGGPKGVGALIVKDNIKISPIMFGGGQERRIRPGTEPVFAIAGFGAAAEEAIKLPLKSMYRVRNYFEEYACKYVPNTIVIGKNMERLPNTTLLCMPKTKSETIVIALDLEGFEVSSGAACSSGKVESSKVLAAMEVKDEISRGSIRISFDNTIVKNDAIRFARSWDKIAKNFHLNR